MDVDSIREYCLSFASATENVQWGDDLCFKVGGKIFVILSLESVPQHLCLKCTPERFEELCEVEDIVPAPYVGRYKWVMLERLDVLPERDLRELIQKSYEMVCPSKIRSGKAARKPARKSASKRIGSGRKTTKKFKSGGRRS